MSADSVDHSAWSEAKLTLMNADGSNRRVLTPTLDRPESGILWASGRKRRVLQRRERGFEEPLVRVDWRAGAPGDERHARPHGHRRGPERRRPSGVRSTPTKPNDVVTFTVPKTGATSTFAQVTAIDDDVLRGKELATTEEVWYTSKDGLKIQGWIVKPPGFDPSRKYPLILEIHGGPQSMYNVAFNFARQDNAANGYVVLYTNPRGSTGYGVKFTNEIKNAYPGKDFDDLMAGVDTVIGRGYIDTKNMFVYGCSGGGVLTAWTVGHTNRFTAAASLCPVIDWISFVGETDGSGWYRNFEKPFWEDPSEYLRRSPIMYVGNVKTPTMLMTGVLDLRTPMPQSEEFYRALKLRGVPTALLRFNNEFHGTSSTPSNFLRTQLYLQELVRQVFQQDPPQGSHPMSRSRPRLRVTRRAAGAYGVGARRADAHAALAVGQRDQHRVRVRAEHLGGAARGRRRPPAHELPGRDRESQDLARRQVGGVQRRIRRQRGRLRREHRGRRTEAAHVELRARHGAGVDARRQERAVRLARARRTGRRPRRGSGRCRRPAAWRSRCR